MEIVTLIWKSSIQWRYWNTYRLFNLKFAYCQCLQVWYPDDIRKINYCDVSYCITYPSTPCGQPSSPCARNACNLRVVLLNVLCLQFSFINASTTLHLLLLEWQVIFIFRSLLSRLWDLFSGLCSTNHRSSGIRKVTWAPGSVSVRLPLSFPPFSFTTWGKSYPCPGVTISLGKRLSSGMAQW